MEIHMPLKMNAMTVGDLTEALNGMEGTSDLPVKVSNYEGDHGMQVYSIRKHVITDDTGEVTDAYVVING